MPETIVRSRNKSFRDLYVAKLTANTVTTYTAEAPVKLARAITGKVSDKFTTEKIYSDDGVEETITTYEGTDVEFEVNSLAPQDRKLLFGHLYENGYLVKSKDDTPPEVAVGYRTKRLNGHYEFVWLYAGKFGQGNEDAMETESDKVKTQTNTLKGEFYERQKDGRYHCSVDESNLIAADTTAAAAIAAWFSTVQEYTVPVPATPETGAGE